MDFSNISFSKIIPQRDQVATSGLMLLVLIVGIILVWQMISLKKTLTVEAAKDACPKSVLPVINVLLVIGILMILAPIVLITVNISGNAGKFKFLAPFEQVLKTQAVVLVASIVIFIMIVYINSALKKCQQNIGWFLWAVSIAFMVLSASFLGFRYFADIQEQKRIANKYLPTKIFNGVQSVFQSAAQGFQAGSGFRVPGLKPAIKNVKRSVAKGGSSGLNTAAAATSYALGAGANAIASGVGAIGSGISSAYNSVVG